MPAVSVVVVNWNAGPVLGDCLASVFAGKPGDEPPEVLLVDNASGDGSHLRALRDHPGLRLLQSETNEGFARAANRGLRAARGDLALLLNPDATLAPTTVAVLAEFLARHPEAAAVGPRLLNPDGSTQGSARRDPSPRTGLFGRTGPLTRLFPGNRLSLRDLPSLALPAAGALEVDWVSGACLMARRAAWERVGLLDERFFLFWEDADWCRRFRQAGWKVYYTGAASAVHRVGVCRARRSVRSAVDFHRSAYRYYRKHYLPSALHPMTLPLAAGLLVSLALRLPRAVRERRPAGPAPTSPSAS